MKEATNRPAHVSVTAYRDDPLYPRIVRAVADILKTGKVVATVDVLVRMDLLDPESLERWRRGRVPYLEAVATCNLTRVSRLLRILRFLAHDLRLVPSVAVYMRWGKGPKQRWSRCYRIDAPWDAVESRGSYRGTCRHESGRHAHDESWLSISQSERFETALQRNPGV